LNYKRVIERSMRRCLSPAAGGGASAAAAGAATVVTRTEKEIQILILFVVQ
jgi:hypothetical protein